MAKRKTKVDEMFDILEKNNVKVVFGLEAQGHIKTIEGMIKAQNDSYAEMYPNEPRTMIYSKLLWDQIGRKIGWCPFTAALSYFEYLEK